MATTTPLRRCGAALTILAGVGLALPAAASSSGRFGYSGKQGATCAQCHTGDGSAPAVSITGVGPELVLGSAAQVNIVIQTNNGDGSGRAAGFGAALDSAGVTLSSNDGAVQLQASVDGDEATHSTKQTYTAGEASFALALTPTAAGSYTLFVAVNDVNNNGGSGAGDDVAATTVSFDVVTAISDAGTGADAGSAADANTSVDAAPPPGDATIEDGAIGDGAGGVDTAPGLDRGYPDVARVPPAAGYGGAEDDGGCGCSMLPARSPLALVLLIALAAQRRRARHTEVR